MNKVAITGSSGFVGKKLVGKLKENKDIELMVFDSKRNSLLKPRTLKGLVNRSEVVYHLAAVNDSNKSGILRTNIIGTLGVLEAIRKWARSSRIVFTSSFAVYKTPSRGEVVDENYAIFPRNIYGFTKLMGEILCYLYSKLFGVKVTIVRISNIYGPGMPPFKHSVISTFIERIKSGKSIGMLGNGNQTRDFIYLDDVIEALMLAGSIKDRFCLLNVCSGEEVSVNKLAELLFIKLNKKINISYKHSLSVEGRWKGSNLKARRKLGWIPKTSLDKGLDNML